MKALFIAVAALVTLPCAWAEGVLLLLADQLRHDGLGPWTPNLRRLANEGVTFTKAYSSTPTCTPARAALLTGLSPWRHGMLGYGAIAQKYDNEMVETIAKRALTYSVGKDHFGFDPNSTLKSFRPFKHGYQQAELYEGIVDEPDQYHREVLQRIRKEPETCWPQLSMK